MKQHRLVTEVLKQEIEGIHGLQASSTILSPVLLTSIVYAIDQNDTTINFVYRSLE